MDIDSALKAADGEDIRNRCHVNSNEDGDRFVGVKADSDKAMVYFPIGYQLPETDQEIRTDIKHLNLLQKRIDCFLLTSLRHLRR